MNVEQEELEEEEEVGGGGRRGQSVYLLHNNNINNNMNNKETQGKENNILGVPRSDTFIEPQTQISSSLYRQESSL